MEDRDSLQRLGELQRREAREYRALAAQHASTAERLRAEAHQLDALARQEGDRASESESFARHIDAFLAGREIGLSCPVTAPPQEAPIDVDTEEEEETTEEEEEEEYHVREGGCIICVRGPVSNARGEHTQGCRVPYL